MRPVGGVDATCIGRAAGLDIVAGAVGEPFQMATSAPGEWLGGGGQRGYDVDDVGGSSLSSSDMP
jgi:hypothetical protein